MSASYAAAASATMSFDRFAVSADSQLHQRPLLRSRANVSSTAGNEIPDRHKGDRPDVRPYEEDGTHRRRLRGARAWWLGNRRRRELVAEYAAERDDHAVASRIPCAWRCRARGC